MCVHLCMYVFVYVYVCVFVCVCVCVCVYVCVCAMHMYTSFTGRNPKFPGPGNPMKCAG